MAAAELTRRERTFVHRHLQGNDQVGETVVLHPEEVLSTVQILSLGRQCQMTAMKRPCEGFKQT